MMIINKQNNRFRIKLKVFELNFIYLTFLNLKSILKSILKRKFKENIVKTFNLFIARLYNVPIQKETLNNSSDATTF